MAILHRRQGHSFSMIHQEGSKGWALCMSKAYCKWPAIAGIVIGVLFFLLALFCCYRCCCRRRGGKGSKKSAQSFIPAPLQGYMPANSNNAPPPPQYAQFDSHTGYRGGGKVTEDSLPRMPSWQDARETRIEEDHYNDSSAAAAAGRFKGENHEMGNLQKPAMTSTAYLPPHQQQQQQQQSGVTEMDSGHAPPHAPSPYTGPDFGAGGGHAQHQQQQYTGPDFATPSHTGYSAYTPSESTKYEPTTYELSSTTSNPQQQAGHPGALQAGRGGHWKDV